MSRFSKIKDVKIIRSGLDNSEEEQKHFVYVGTESCIPKNRDEIPLYADEPCVEACQILYDLNIQTYTSGGHIENNDNTNEIAFIGIVYDTLSEENKNVVESMIQSGLIDGIHNNESRGTGLTITLSIPINGESLIGEVSDSLVKLANLFHQQDVLYGKKTLDEIKTSIFSKLANGSYLNYFTHEVLSEEEMIKSLPEWVDYECENMYTSDGYLYFVSEDLLNKHLSYLKRVKCDAINK